MDIIGFVVTNNLLGWIITHSASMLLLQWSITNISIANQFSRSWQTSSWSVVADQISWWLFTPIFSSRLSNLIHLCYSNQFRIYAQNSTLSVLLYQSICIPLSPLFSLYLSHPAVHIFKLSSSLPLIIDHSYLLLPYRRITVFSTGI